MQYCFVDHTLDTNRRELRHASDALAVEPQVFDLLVYLVENRDRVVSKDELIASVWGGRIVSDSTLSSRINAARRAIGDSGAALVFAALSALIWFKHSANIVRLLNGSETKIGQKN